MGRDLSAPRHRALATCAVLAWVGLIAVTSVLAEGEARIAVKVVDESGAPVPSVAIALVDQVGPSSENRVVVTDGKGVGAMGSLAPSRYKAVVASEDYRVAGIHFAARDAPGVLLAKVAEDDVSTNGNPTLELGANARGRLTITVAVGSATDAAAAGIEELKGLIAADPSDPDPYLRLANLQIVAGAPKEAVDTLKATPGSGDGRLELLHRAAMGLWNREDLDGTVAAMDVAIELDPGNPSFHQLRGRALLSNGAIPDGVAALKEFIRLSPAGADVDNERRLIEVFSERP